MQKVTAPEPEPTSVYRYYDTHGVLIYVGITKRGTSRNTEHNKRARWWPHVARQEVEHYPSRPAALNRERELIIQYRPPFNTQHNPDAHSLRNAYEAFMASGTPNEGPLDIHKRLGKRIPLAAASTADGIGYQLRSYPQHLRYASRIEVDPYHHTIVLDRHGARIGVVDARIPHDSGHLALRVTGAQPPPDTQVIAEIRTITLKRPERFRIMRVLTDTTAADVRTWRAA